ncbi:hypothetical protein RhoFasB10_03288 [Rhodococcus sp. B10]|nr:hypothetical protein [Rhodococcus sp. B10]
MSRHSVLEVAVYDADSLVAVGKVDDVAEELGVKPETIRWYLAPTYQRRLSKRKTLTKSRVVVRLDEDD